MNASPFDPNDIEALKRRLAELETMQSASITGSGATTQDGGNALGQGAVQVQGDHAGVIITGTLIVQHYPAPEADKNAIAEQVAGYLRWLRASTEHIVLRGIEQAGSGAVVRLPLERAYVPLQAKSMNWHENNWPKTRREDERDLVEIRGNEKDIELSQLLGQGMRLAVTGGPGSGKTTVLLHIAWALATSLLSGEPEPAQSRLGLTLPAAALPLPILVPLASFARHRRSLPDHAPAREHTLSHFISHHLIAKEANFDLPPDFFVSLLRDGRNVILMLDGLDEVANEDERAAVRQSVEDLVAGREAMRVIVTCRTIAYRGGRTALGADFREIAVQALDPEAHIAPMVKQAYACIYPHDTALCAERADDLLRGIRRLEDERRARHDQAEPLTATPLMVRLLLIVHMNNRALPDERAELFDKAINALLQVDYGREERVNTDVAGDWRTYREMAQHLALHMHGQGQDQGREIEESALRASLRQEEEFRPRIEDFLRQARERGSVLEERGGAYRFIHLAFQEFLAARYLKEIVGGEGREALLTFLDAHWDDPWWREPILLLAGYMAMNSPRTARDFLGQLAHAGATPNARFAAAELAAAAVLEWRASPEVLRADCARHIVDLLADPAALGGSKAVLRARAGDRLAALGDPRFHGPERFYLPADENLGFMRIPADPDFCIGTRRAGAAWVAGIVGRKVQEDEFNDAPTPTPEFWIARYSVTVAQFRAYLNATGRGPGNVTALRDPDTRPVRWVNWHEALAYVAWLNETFEISPALADTTAARLVRGSWRAALPSELEWEKATRGGLAGAVFPWGDDPDPERANYDDSGIGNTSAAGCFPANGYGLFDMSGNVWEWTRSLWGKNYPYLPEGDGRETLRADNDQTMVVRGGSWGGARVSSRCAARFGLRPNRRYDLLGFRVVLIPAPVRLPGAR